MPLLMTLVCLLVAGCGSAVSDMPALGKVNGTVTLDGKPLANAVVRVQPPDSRASEGTTDANGAYTLRFDNQNYGAKLGSHTVTITTRSEAYSKPPVDGKEGELVPGQPETVPAKYFKPGALTAEVKADGKPIDFALTK